MGAVKVDGGSKELILVSWCLHQRRELLLAFRSPIGFKAGDFMTIGMNEKRAAWFMPRFGQGYASSVARAF